MNRYIDPFTVTVFASIVGIFYYFFFFFALLQKPLEADEYSTLCLDWLYHLFLQLVERLTNWLAGAFLK